MSFDEYAEVVDKMLDAWLDSLIRRKSDVADLKQSAEDMISGWKDAFPRQQKKISGMVNNKIAERLG